ncbi:peptidoglycan-binding domain-containing protein [Lysobacter capsici]|uniref:peptidoglycan-binding domain-containing protein n=1 Tax=Lysobacter capsici TaxID=435897 RepID=UPI00287B84ED|nr:peptidoglycan-binding domain-containing protein [Lysobacter capsici]WND82994.1 peptidoglycan-binding domain-containing protein [Lysobacter capsici]WND88193.1 peptidoglycan-binding domain-containing protein [Lysobacter capsici]
MADGVLSQREKGQEVRELQERLNELGYTVASGQPLRADGNFGQKTKEAVKAFQQDHDGLTVDGIAGSKTLDALKTATAKDPAQDTPTPTQASSQPAQPAKQGTAPAQTATDPLLSDPTHPDHGLYKEALAGIEKLGPQGFKDQAERERAAATLTYEAKVSGMSKIDHVVPNASGTGLFAVQGALNDPAHQRIYTDKAQAVQQPVDKTTEQLS